MSFSARKIVSALIVGVLGSILAAIIMMKIEPRLKERFFPPERKLIYSLTVQKMRDDKPYQEPFQSVGQEIFENGYKFKLNLYSSEAGYIYLFNEGMADDSRVYFNILYPTPNRNNGSAQVAANQQIVTEDNKFGGQPDTEKLWIAWTKEPQPELESARTSAFANAGKIKSDSEARSLREFLEKHSARQPEINRDIAHKQTVLKSTSEIIVSLLSLEHR
jgi:hypothetical protein